MARSDTVLSIWKDETQVEKLKTLWAEGLSASQIAKDIGHGLSRSAILGKIHRLGLSNRPQPVRPPRDPKPRVRRVPSPHGNANRTYVKPMLGGRGHSTLQMMEAVDVPFVPREADVIPKDLDLLQLTEETCKFPYGTGTAEDPYRFCGHDAKPHSPYCRQHHAIAHTPSREIISSEESARRSAAQKRAFAQRAKVAEEAA